MCGKGKIISKLFCCSYKQLKGTKVTEEQNYQPTFPLIANNL